MNYYDARPLADGSGFHFTSFNRRGGTHAVGFCADHQPHDTADEARECFRSYLISDPQETTFSDWTGCAVCDEPTKKGLRSHSPLGGMHALCDQHRTSEQFAALTAVPGQIMASY